jgi:hypothetical protein
MSSRIMYVERKAEGPSGRAHIGRVAFSKTGRTLYYDGKSFQSLKGYGFKANYFEVGRVTTTGSQAASETAPTGSTASECR